MGRERVGKDGITKEKRGREEAGQGRGRAKLKEGRE